MSDTFERYSRQVIFEGIREPGQRKLLDARVVQVGCGALGSTIASLMVRAGIGHYTIIDRDLPEIHNLQRQILFDEDDVKQARPKADIAVDKLRRANSEVEVQARHTVLDKSNVDELLAGAHLVMDATDNMETRYLINDYCVREGIPWIYGGVVAASGMTMNILPGEGPCLRCVFADAPEPGQIPVVNIMGIIASIPSVIASIQVSEAIKLIIGSPELSRDLNCIDLWRLELRNLQVVKNPSCECCGKRNFAFL